MQRKICQTGTFNELLIVCSSIEARATGADTTSMRFGSSEFSARSCFRTNLSSPFSPVAHISLHSTSCCCTRAGPAQRGRLGRPVLPRPECWKRLPGARALMLLARVQRRQRHSALQLTILLLHSNRYDTLSSPTSAECTSIVTRTSTCHWFVCAALCDGAPHQCAAADGHERLRGPVRARQVHPADKGGRGRQEQDLREGAGQTILSVGHHETRAIMTYDFMRFE